LTSSLAGYGFWFTSGKYKKKDESLVINVYFSQKIVTHIINKRPPSNESGRFAFSK